MPPCSSRFGSARAHPSPSWSGLPTHPMRRRARLRRLLDDPDAHIRINALRALASFRDSTVAGAVVPLVADRDIGVAVQAETTLGVLRGAAALAALRPRLTNSVFALKRQALIAVAQADSGAGVTAAVAVTNDGDWRWRSVAAEAYGAARPGARSAHACRPGGPQRRSRSARATSQGRRRGSPGRRV